ncbi:hypothetical protein BJ165DRAFT_1566479 [Panaeolus papilionaceus]|nr:hypothetical protein BJ165DRAFT_1566479 [Panaeolus papilionaceus]
MTWGGWEIDIDKAARALSYVDSALRNPHKPTRCAKSLSVALTIVTRHYLLFSNEYQSKRDSLRATLYAFLTAVRTDEELDAMMQKMDKCECRTDDDPSSFHFQCIQKRSKFVWDDAQHVLQAVLAEFELLFNRTPPTPVHKGISEVWPMRVSQLLPFGADQLVASIFQWYRFFPNPMVTRFALQILKMCGDLVHDAFLKADVMNTLFVAHTRKYVDDALACTTPAQIHQLTFLFAYQAITFIRFLPHPMDNLQGHGTAAKLMAGAETKVVQLCSLILYIVGSPHNDTSPPLNEDLADIKKEATSMGQHIFRQYAMDRAPGPPMRLHPSLVADDRTQPASQLSSDVFREIAVAMYAARFQYNCAIPGCQTRLIDPDAPLRTCSGCSTVRYCGESCQTKDWMEGPFKHKKLCKIFSKVVGVFGPWKLPPISNSSTDTRQDDINRRSELIGKLTFAIAKMLMGGGISHDDFRFILQWAQAVTNDNYATGEWNPGYDDYEDLLQRFENSPLFNGPKGWSERGHRQIPEAAREHACHLRGYLRAPIGLIGGNIGSTKYCMTVKIRKYIIAPTIISFVHDLPYPGDLWPPPYAPRHLKGCEDDDVRATVSLNLLTVIMFSLDSVPPIYWLMFPIPNVALMVIMMYRLFQNTKFGLSRTL